MRVVDLSIAIEPRMHTYPGEPRVLLSHLFTHEKDNVNILRIDSIDTHAGTHVDVPLHHIENGLDASSFPLDRFIGEAIAIWVPRGPKELVTPGHLLEADIRKDDILAVYMGWEHSRSLGTFFTETPGFSSDCADFLIGKGIKCVATDAASVDSITNLGAPFHHKVLEAGIGIVEALVNLKELVGKRFFFAALPLKIAGGDGSPVRAVALFDDAPK
jgi:kynurenine formamidase